MLHVPYCRAQPTAEHALLPSATYCRMRLTISVIYRPARPSIVRNTPLSPSHMCLYKCHLFGYRTLHARHFASTLVPFARVDPKTLPLPYELFVGNRRALSENLLQLTGEPSLPLPGTLLPLENDCECSELPCSLASPLFSFSASSFHWKTLPKCPLPP
ncbi:hypothetical protein AMTR_s00087p00133400 [Amborella trichopoda]|uniref:Uncharacterized protein n=1 Tax=Amborella trichopoda TaxID=13333 RepID=W1P3T6_AMBTC|nr:hypothetical protein AMTR_s00087p00133400 [Amborella trichopoda]